MCQGFLKSSEYWNFPPSTPPFLSSMWNHVGYWLEMSHVSPSTRQSHSLLLSPSPFLAPRFLRLFTGGPSLYRKAGLTIAKRGGAPENQLPIYWRAALNEKEISAPWNTCPVPEEVPELLTSPKVEQKPIVMGTHLSISIGANALHQASHPPISSLFPRTHHKILLSFLQHP